MGVNQTKTFETDGRGTESREIGDQDAPVRSDNDISNLSPAADQNPDLTIDFPRDLRQQPGNVLCNDAIRRYLPPVYLTNPFDLLRFETAQIAVYPVNCVNSPFKYISDNTVGLVFITYL
jgi:hypothetical protein